ncbi:DUF3011 domain-containing protein [Roseofilum sp. BLCC_M91]|uniref:DUF3011 domain-containing protein n=1 Tax=Roseofilum halophilum BLCC-M91 TaxID=3022259 RepID=A0ABT7BE56_9CYAN|nr:DUF3011 domain-containing protein [Roseofilum halophilum]MDJ1177451.1 DUF3011 domain-containing protein [Roseofilum halophilum BLCC-M91]
MLTNSAMRRVLQSYLSAALFSSVMVGISAINLQPATAQRQQPPRSVRCESRDAQPANCPIDTRDGVTLVEQYSTASCIGNWGFGNGFVWVRNGCRARFETNYAQNPGGGGFFGPPGIDFRDPVRGGSREQVGVTSGIYNNQGDRVRTVYRGEPIVVNWNNSFYYGGRQYVRVRTQDGLVGWMLAIDRRR